MGSSKTIPKRVYASGDPKETHCSLGSYWHFWEENGFPLDFGASPSVNTFKQAKRLVNKYYPDAEVIQGRPPKAS